jgi:hypothetical protein
MELGNYWRIKMTEKKQVLPEAPASVTIKAVSSKGYDMMFTLRDADEQVLLKRLIEYFKKLEEDIGVHPTLKPPGNGNGNVSQNIPEDDPGYCRIHSTAMKRHEKDGQHWYSHKVGDDWCKGK